MAVRVSDVGPSRDDLKFLAVSAPQMGAPENRPGTDRPAVAIFYKHLLKAARDFGVSADQIHLVVRRLPDQLTPQITCFAYGKGQKITPIIFESEHFDPWIHALVEDHDARRVAIGHYAPDFHLTGELGIRIGDMQDGALLENATGAWLREHRPESWKVEGDEEAKTAFVEQLQQTAPDPVEFDDLEIARAWKDLVQHAGIATADAAVDADIERFATATGFEMPPQLDVLLRLSNGASSAFGFRDLLSVDQIIAEWRGWKEIFDERTLAGLQSGSTAADDRTVGIYTNPRWVPFARDSGNSVAIDLLPGPAGRQGQVIYFGADESHNVRVLAHDLATFIRLHIELDPTGEGEAFF